MLSLEIVEKAISALKSGSEYKYFFEKINSAEWIRPLWEKGFFKNPPAPIKEGTSIRFPLWPESQFLKRIARKAPELVVEVALNIPETENIRVHEDIAELMLEVPAEISVALTPKLLNWIGSQYQLLLPEILGKLIPHFAENGQVDASLEIADKVLDVYPDPRASDDKANANRYFSPEPQPGFDLYEYEEILKASTDAFIGVQEFRFFDLLCKKLDKAIKLSLTNENPKPPSDISVIWRPAIEDHEQNRLNGLKSILVTSARDVVEGILRNAPNRIEEFVNNVDNRGWFVFQRLSLHIIRLFPDNSKDLIDRKLTDKDIFLEHNLWHEYFLLLKSQFYNLSNNNQDLILGWIKSGPNDIEKFSKRIFEKTKVQPSQDDIDRHIKYWQIGRIWPIKDFIAGEWKTFFEDVYSETGEPEHPSFLYFSSGTWVGPTSPKKLEELESMSPEETVNFLKNWVPAKEHFSPSVEGLSRLISNLVSKFPGKFENNALDFRTLDPTYVRALFSGLREAVVKNSKFQWGPYLDLAAWVVTQPCPNIEDDEYLDRDTSWGWTRKSIASLLGAGFDATGSIPFQHREVVWGLLNVLASDSEPTVDYEKKYEGMGPIGLSINTTRGEAIHSVVRYAIWVHLNLQENSGKKTIEFEEMPEVEKVLSEHLDLSVDPTLTIRAVYGQWFQQLTALAPKWVKMKFKQIFPQDPELLPYRNIAWVSFLSFNSPTESTFKLLYDEYMHAVENLSKTDQSHNDYFDTHEMLVHHLMVLYWWGDLSLDKETCLLPKFYKIADDELCEKASVFIGRTLSSTDDVPAEVKERLKSLWEWRLVSIQREPRDHQKELSAFGWWFSSGKFEDDWMLDQFELQLELVGTTDATNFVGDRLLALTDTNGLRVVSCLKKIFEGADGWKVHVWRKKAREILVKVLKGEDEGAKAVAIDLIHWLGNKNFYEFRDLLN